MHTQNTRSKIQAKQVKLNILNNFIQSSNQTQQEQQDKFTIQIYTWASVQELRKKIFKKTGIPQVITRLFHKTVELTQNQATLDSYAVRKGATIVMYETRDYKTSRGDIRQYCIFSDYMLYGNYQQQEMKKLKYSFERIDQGFYQSFKPELTLSGTSGSYFLKDGDKKNAAIFKPMDEEAFAPNNPRGYQGELGQMGFRKGILSGESATREVAAYILDFEASGGFHGVPITTYVEFFHPAFNDDDNNIEIEDTLPKQKQLSNQISPSTSATQSSENTANLPLKKLSTKHGSLQLFKKHDGVVGDYGDSLFPVDDIHRIGILDIRILNCDRNEENILLKKIDKQRTGTIVQGMIPIDHGLSLPSNFEIMDYEIVWMGWGAAKKPFSQECLDFIENINIDENLELLKTKLKVRDICLRNFKIANICLKKYAKKGYTLFQIGEILYREDEEKPSLIEEVLEWAGHLYKVKKQLGHNQKIQEVITLGRNKKQNLKLLKKLSTKEFSPPKKTSSNNSNSNSNNNTNNTNFNFINNSATSTAADNGILLSSMNLNNDSNSNSSSNNNINNQNNLESKRFSSSNKIILNNIKEVEEEEKEEEQCSPLKHTLNQNNNNNTNNIDNQYDMNQNYELSANNENEKEKETSLALQISKKSKLSEISSDEPQLKRLKKSSSLPNLCQIEYKTSSDEEEKYNMDPSNLQLSHQNSELTCGTNKTSIGKNRLKSNIPGLDDSNWDDVYYECIDNAMDYLIGSKHQDFPRAPSYTILEPKKQSSRSRFMSSDINLDEI